MFTEDTSLFAEIEFSNKITEKMKLEILGNKKNNIIINIRKNDISYHLKNYSIR